MYFVIVIIVQPGNTSPEAVHPASALCSLLFSHHWTFKENLYSDL